MHGPAPGPGAQPPHSHLFVSRQFTATDDKGVGYTLRFIFRTGITGSAVWAGVLDLRPDPPHEIGWLDLRTAPGEPATRIRLDAWLKYRTAALNLRNLIGKGLTQRAGAWALAS